MITLVVPLRIDHTPRRALRRLAGLLAAAPSEFPVIVVDDTASPARRAETAAIIGRFPHARHLHHAATAQEPFSIGRLRDAGAEAAPDGPVLFHDVDFFAPGAVYRRLAAYWRDGGLGQTEGAFVCAPVAFLTRLGTRVARAAPRVFWPSLARPGARRSGLVDRVVAGSSAMLMERRTLIEAGGHDPAFRGHGAEDFDLMHRLSLRFPRGPRPPDYALDFGSRNTESRGFRAYFARYGAPLLENGICLAHAWHPPRREDARYYGARGENFALLDRRMRRGPDRGASAYGDHVPLHRAPDPIHACGEARMRWRY